MKCLEGTIGECLRLRSEASPFQLGISYQELNYNWKEIDEITDFLAVEYQKMGISHGSHGAIWSFNSPNWIFCFLALVKIGAIPVMVNTCYKCRELESLLRRMDVDYLFYGEGTSNINFLETLEELPYGQLPMLKKRIPLQNNGINSGFIRSDFPESLSKGDRELLNQSKAAVDKQDTACIIPTSGTSSRPKGVMLSHDSLINNSKEVGRQMRWGETDKLCISVPLFHCFGISTGVLAAISTGSSLHILKYYKTEDVMKEIEHHKCTVLNGVPTMFLSISKRENRPSYDLSSLKSGIVAGSPVTPAEYGFICQSLLLDKLQVSYGQTESSPCITISDYDDILEKKSYTAGKTISGIEMRIWNLQSQTEAKTGEPGEIQTRGYHVMQGYYGMKEETDKVIDSEGWLHTGDMGCVDEDGYLQVTGRIKEMIIRGGENIAPLEIEECIGHIEGIEAVKVVGVKAEVMQEEIAACIIVKQGCEVDPECVRAYVKTKLADYKVPRYILIFNSFPLGPSGKVQTGELKKQMYQRLER